MYKPAITADKGLSLKYTIGEFGYIQVAAANTVAKTEAALGDITAYTLTTSAAAVTVPTGNNTYFQVAAGPSVGALYADGAVIAAGTSYYMATRTAAVVAADALYKAGVNVQIKPVASDTLTVTIDGGAWMDFDSSDMIFTAKAAMAMGDLSVSGALDAGLAGASGSKMKMDAAANVAYKLFEGKDSANLDFYFANDIVTGAADKPYAEIGLKFVDAEGLVPGLAFTLAGFYNDLLDSSKFDPKHISFAESLSYKYALSDTTYVKPYQALRFDLSDTGLYDNAVMYFNIGIEAGLIPNTVFTADYFMGTKGRDDNSNLAKASKDASVISFKAKVSL